MVKAILLPVAVLALLCGPGEAQTTTVTVASAIQTSVPTILPGRADANSSRAAFIQLPNQWSLAPVGKIIPMGDFPASMAVSPNGRYAAVLHCGWGQHEVRILDLTSQTEVCSAPLRNAWVGVDWAPRGDALYVSGGTNDFLVRFGFDGKALSPRTVIYMPIAKDSYHDPVDELAASLRADHTTSTQVKRPRYPSGIAVSSNGKFAYVAEMYASRLTRVQLPGPKTDVRFQADARILTRFEAHAYPYRVLMHPREPVAYVSLWGGSGVAVVNVKTGNVERIATEPHPNEMALSADGSRLFVACANSNHVNVIDTLHHKVIERLDTALYPDAPAGSTPNGLALAKDGKLLLVANADNNNIALFDVSDRDSAVPLGFVPTGWYPTCVGFMPSGGIVAISGKGNGSMANPNGPVPGVHEPGRQYIGGLIMGSAAFIDWPAREKLDEYTSLSYRASPLRGDFAPVGAATDGVTTNAIPYRVGDASPIRHIVYIVKENRTYDQVFGDMAEGNGDPSLCLFGEAVTPNHHALVRQFVLLDNFYCDAEVSADGHEWSMGAYATDFVERTWPTSYGNHGAIGFPAEGKDPNGFPPAGHLWDRAKEAGVSYRSYGEFVEGGVNGNAKASAPALVGHIDQKFPEFDMNIPDEARAAEFIRELRLFEENGNMPGLCIIRLPCDHTVGTRPNHRTPRAYVAEHDQGFGSIMEALTHSRYWKEMAVFVVEDDAQNGSDHVDAHRTVAMVASPYVKRGHVDHSLYSTTSMLRTIELILGLQPMSQYDAAARPMYESFTSVPDDSGFDKRAPHVSLTEMNSPRAPMAKIAAKMDFTHEDANPDVLFNEIIWKSVKGAESAMPAPIRAAFIRPLPESEEEEAEESEGKRREEKGDKTAKHKVDVD